jgi:CheY-like chemotaxis protein
MSQAAPKIMVVEDSPDVRAVMVRLLRYGGYDVIETVNGQEALARMREHEPALVLLDLSMPVMNGWMTLSAIRALPGGDRIPVVAVTAHAMTGDREAALKHGFDAYVTKPLDIHVFLDTVAKMLRR